MSSIKLISSRFIQFNFLKPLLGAVALVAVFSATIANATVINFDDLHFDEENPAFYDNPVTDQYGDKGLIIDGGFLQQYWSGSEGVISSPNYLLAGIYMSLNFVGELPTFVSMYVNSFRHEAIYFEAFGESGFIEMKKTKGFAGPFDDTPYEPAQFISFTAAEGIKSITVYGFYGRSTAGEIDNLTYTYSVPEPSPLILFAVGLFGLCSVAMRRKKLFDVKEHLIKNSVI